MLLSDKDQWNNLWDKGSFLTHYITPDHKYALYALYDFFIEVELDPITDKIISKAEFKTGAILDRYSGSIDITKI